MLNNRKEVESVNEGEKQVLGDVNQDKKLAIQFFPDRGAPCVLKDVMAGLEHNFRLTS